MTPILHTPTLHTPILDLRMPAPQDLPACTAFWASDRSHMMGGPWTAEQTARETDDVIDMIGPFFPGAHPEPELGWSLCDENLEGQGLALGAAIAARDWFFAATPYRTAISHTDPANLRSHRMGAVVDATAPHPYGDEPTLTYRHFAGGAA